MIDTFVRIAKRDNNSKRKYLVLNKSQGKHVPVAPSISMEMFKKLADAIKEYFINEKLLLIGFAETATAIGATVSTELDTYYIQTTREDMGDVDYLFFSEEHSHATEQKVVKNSIDKIINEVDRIVFIEDEITTGNTILNAINAFENKYKVSFKYGVASILNGMSYEHEQKYKEKCVPVLYLKKIDNSKFDSLVSDVKSDGYNFKPMRFESLPYPVIDIKNIVDARLLVKGNEYKEACERFWEELQHQIKLKGNVLVLGSEEFMYPPLFIASKIEKMGFDVKFHATTRSPIVVSENKDYPLHSRFEIKSLYNKDRNTFLYDLEKYDTVVVITDSKYDDGIGYKELLEALNSKGNDNIYFVRWC